jgi:hypothetical protein
MPVLLLFALFASGFAIGQSRNQHRDYQPQEMSCVETGTCDCSAVRPGRPVSGCPVPREPEHGGGNSGPSRRYDEQDDRQSSGPGGMGRGRTEGRPQGDGPRGQVEQTSDFDPIAEARARGLRSPHSAGEHQEALNLARRYQRPAISWAEREIRRGERVEGADAESIAGSKAVVEKLRSARIVDGADGCAVNPDGLAFVSSTAANTIHVCPALGSLPSRNRDKAVMFILVHEAAHLYGISDEDVANGIAELILDWNRP